MSELKRAVEWDMTCGITPSKEQDLKAPIVQLGKDLVDEEYKELQEGHAATDLTEVLDALGDVLKVVSFHCVALNVDPEELLKEVNDSNFSKFCYYLDDAEASVAKYKDSGDYKHVHYVKVDNTYIIKGWKIHQDPEVDTPKVLKGIHFVKPDLSKFIKELKS